MATLVKSLNFSTNSDAQFRAWGSEISSAINTVGLTKTADTGQIDWTTVARPGTVEGEHIGGYEMWQLNDGLTATAPVLIKIEYGNLCYRNGSTGYLYRMPIIYVTTGTASNGAGTLSATQISTRVRYVGHSAWNAPGLGTDVTNDMDGLSTCLFMSDGSSLFIGLGIQSARQARMKITVNDYWIAPGFPAMLLVERSRDTNGAPNGNGIVTATARWQANTWYQAHISVHSAIFTWQTTSFTGSNAGALEGHWMVNWPGQGFSTAISGTDTYVFPAHMATPKAQGQMLSILGTYKSDVTMGTNIVFTVSAQPRTYRSMAGIGGLSDNDNSRSYVNGIVPSGALFVKWE